MLSSRKESCTRTTRCFPGGKCHGLQSHDTFRAETVSDKKFMTMSHGREASQLVKGNTRPIVGVASTQQFSNSPEPTGCCKISSMQSMPLICQECGKQFALKAGGVCKQCRRTLCATHLSGRFGFLHLYRQTSPVCIRCKEAEETRLKNERNHEE